MKTFGEIIKNKRKARKWTQSDFAEMLNTYPSTVSSWETDRTVPNIYTAIDIADVFGCTLDELVGRRNK